MTQDRRHGNLVKYVHTNVLLFKHLYFNEQKTCEANKKQINYHIMNLSIAK